VFCYRYCSLWHRTVSARCGRGRSACPVWDRALAWLPAPAAVPAGCQHAQDHLVSEFPADLRRPPGPAFVHGPPRKAARTFDVLLARRLTGQSPPAGSATGSAARSSRGSLTACGDAAGIGRDRPPQARIGPHAGGDVVIQLGLQDRDVCLVPGPQPRLASAGQRTFVPGCPCRNLPRAPDADRAARAGRPRPRPGCRIGRQSWPAWGSSSVSVAGLGQAVFVGVDDCLDPVAQIELGEDAPDVGLDRGLGQEQLPGDLGVG
jgi:hypothetical protein